VRGARGARVAAGQRARTALVVARAARGRVIVGERVRHALAVVGAVGIAPIARVAVAVAAAVAGVLADEAGQHRFADSPGGHGAGAGHWGRTDGWAATGGFGGRMRGGSGTGEPASSGARRSGLR